MNWEQNVPLGWIHCQSFLALPFWNCLMHIYGVIG